MSKMAKTDIEREKQILSDCWEFRKKYYYGEEPDEFWEQAQDELEEISRKHRSVYVDMILVTCLIDIESRYRKKVNSAYQIPDANHLKHVLQAYQNLKDRYNEKGERIGSQD